MKILDVVSTLERYAKLYTVATHGSFSFILQSGEYFEFLTNHSDRSLKVICTSLKTKMVMYEKEFSLDSYEYDRILSIYSERFYESIEKSSLSYNTLIRRLDMVNVELFYQNHHIQGIRIAELDTSDRFSSLATWLESPRLDNERNRLERQSLERSFREYVEQVSPSNPDSNYQMMQRFHRDGRRRF